MPFAAESATRVLRALSSPKTYLSHLSHTWLNPAGAPFGGLTCALVLKSLVTHLPRHPDPLTLSLQYVGVPPPGAGGDVEVDVEERRVGRTFAFMEARLYSVGAGTRTLLVNAVATMGNLGTLRASPSFVQRRPLATEGYRVHELFPLPEECVESEMPEQNTFRRHFRFREDPVRGGRAREDVSKFDKERADVFPSGSPVWYGARDGQPADMYLACMFADTIPAGYTWPKERLVDPNAKMTYSTLTMTLDFHSRIPEGNGPWMLVDYAVRHKQNELRFEEFKL